MTEPTDTTRPCAICGLLCRDPLCPNCQETVPGYLQVLATTPEEQWSRQTRFYPEEIGGLAFWRVHLSRYRYMKKHGASIIPTRELADQSAATPREVAAAWRKFVRFTVVVERDAALRRYA